ncbi:hypothetical protein TEA_028989 [Camellia sinensis var. sinensis]|uniref:Uncharacterized protein n=1 Tax=Camellia sinensis var. sinensis TaxID=542762 RepID=A0A4S4E9F5_CAMSN|nr:hypothetical protein TEA_028989 [Camellia sinensis var. sinensis]
MATAYLRTPTFQAPLSSRLDTTNSSKSPKHLTWASLRQSHTFPNRCRIHYSSNSSSKLSHRRLKFFPFASYGETTETDEKEEVQESQIQNLTTAAQMAFEVLIGHLWTYAEACIGQLALAAIKRAAL